MQYPCSSISKQPYNHKYNAVANQVAVTAHFSSPGKLLITALKPSNEQNARIKHKVYLLCEKKITMWLSGNYEKSTLHGSVIFKCTFSYSVRSSLS